MKKSKNLEVRSEKSSEAESFSIPNSQFLIPPLRFPEFRGKEAWKPVTLEEASTPVTERVGERKLTPVSISAGIGFVPQAEKFGRDISGNQYQLYTLVRDGDFVFNKGNSLKFPQGCVYQLKGWGEVAAPNVFICFRLKKGFSDGFFQQCFEQNQHGRELKRHITSGARSNGLLNISKETFFGVEIPTPSPAEQQKIAECLSSVDEVIAAQVRKLDALKSHKKGLMQQLFPREGETQPRLRFPEFQNAGEWVNKPLDDLGEIITGKTPSTKESELWGGDILFITPTDISEDDKYQHTTARTVVETKSTKVLPEGSVVYTCIASIGKMALTVRPSITNQQINAVVPNKKALGEFIYYALANLTPWIKTIPASNTLPIINKTDFSKIAILHPADHAEQHRIATSLSSLDALIAAETQKHAALQRHKRGLMQQLFPSPEKTS